MVKKDIKRIALFFPSLRGGGAERVMLDLGKAFARNGLEVTLVLARAEGPFLSEVPYSIKVVDFKSDRVLFCLPALVRYLRKERPDALLSALGHANLVAVWARMLSCVPVRLVVSEHSTLTVSLKDVRKRVVRWIPQLMGLFYRRADGIVTVSKGVAKDLAKATGLPAQSISTIYNPVIMPDLYTQMEESFEHPWFAPGEPPVILGVGRLTPAKDFSNLVNAFSILRAQMNARLLILGEGEERAKLEELIHEYGLEKDVSLPGFVKNPFICMRHASVFVLSSAWEGLPSVLIQAMACGASVVATDCPSGPYEILNGGEYGELVPVGNPEMLAIALMNTLKHNEKIQYGSWLNQFTEEHVVKQYCDLLNDI